MTVFAIILGFVFAIVGVVKVLGVEHMALQFDEFGLGRVAMRIVGALEVAAAVGLQIDSVRTWAALGMIVTMCGAIFFHAKVNHGKDMFVPAVVVMVASAVFFVLSL